MYFRMLCRCIIAWARKATSRSIRQTKNGSGDLKAIEFEAELKRRKTASYLAKPDLIRAVPKNQEEETRQLETAIYKLLS